MSRNNRNGEFARRALGAACGVVLIVAGGAGAAYAVDDQDDNLLPDVKFFRSVMRAIGLRNGQEAGIEYKERPPLVLPPGRDLPPPAKQDVISNNPAWPVDPDETRRKAEKKADAERKPYDWLASGNSLTPGQLAAGRTDKPAIKSGEGPDHSPELTPGQLGVSSGGLLSSLSFSKIFGGGKEMETAKFVREPARNSLTDPPTGYRTPSPDHPYGVNTRDNGVAAKGPEDRQTGTIGK